jgi:hypothetical protein
MGDNPVWTLVASLLGNNPVSLKGLSNWGLLRSQTALARNDRRESWHATTGLMSFHGEWRRRHG